MGQPPATDSFLDQLLGRFARRKPVEAPVPVNPVLAMLERLYAGERPDYCLYLRPAAGVVVEKPGPLSIDLETLMFQALDPLPVVVVDEYSRSPSDSGLPDESFAVLAGNARLLWLVPTDEPRFLARLKLIKSEGILSRCVFAMPEQGTLGSVNWPTIWPTTATALSQLNLDLSGYTAGGWLFRIDQSGKACTFRPIVNPNKEKIARALESICQEME